MAKSDIDPELLKQAEELNIVVTDEATAEAVQAAIDEVLAEDAGAANAGDTKASTPHPLDHDGDGKKGGSKPKKAKAEAETPAAKTYPYRINRDFWDDSGERHRKGQIIEMTADDAQDGLESGAISRVKG